MFLQIQCPVCKQAFVVSADQAGQQVQCPQGHVLAIQSFPTPTQAPGSGVVRTVLEPTAAPPVEPTPQAPPPKSAAGPRKTAALAAKKPAGSAARTAPSAARSRPATGAPPTRSVPAPDAAPAPKARLGMAILCGGVLLLFLAGTGGLAVFLILHPGDKGGTAAPSAEVRLVVGDKQEVDEEFRVRAAVRNPAPGQTLTLELPDGVRMVSGNPEQEVPAAGADGEALLTWTVKGTVSGRRKLTVRSSTGDSQEVAVVLARASEPVAEGPGQPGSPTGEAEPSGKGKPSQPSGPGGDSSGSRARVVVRVLGGERQEVGKDVSVDALLPGAAEKQKLKLELPEGVSLVSGDARQEVDPANKLQRAASWVVKAEAAGSKLLTVRCDNGSSQSVQVSFRDRPMTVAGGKLDLHKMDKLDLNTLDVKMEPPKEDERTPDVWDGHTNHIRCVAFTDDGRLVISVSGDMNREIKRPPDNSIRVWDARRGKQLHKVEGFKEALDSLSLSPGGRFALFAAGDYWKGDEYIRTEDTGIYMWDIQSKKVVSFDGDEPGEGGKARPRFHGLTNSVFATAFSPDCKFVVGVDSGSGIVLWETESGRVVFTNKIRPIRGIRLGLRQVAFTPDGEYLVCDCSDYTLRVHRREDGRAVSLPLQSHLDIIWGLAVTKHADGTVLALSGGGNRQLTDGDGFEPGARDYAIRLWDLTRGRVVRQFTGHQELVSGVAFCPDGRHFVSCSKDESVRLWDLATGKQLRLLGRQKGVVNAVAVSPDGRSCVSGGADCKVHFWRLPHGQDVVEALARNDLPALQKAAADMDVIGPGALAALSGLVDALNHQRQPFRPVAARILARLSELSAPRGIPYEDTHVDGLNKALQSDNPAEVHVLAAQGLGQVGPRASRAVPTLIHAVEAGTAARVAAAAAEALGKIGDKTAAVFAALQKALEHADAGVRSRALEALTRLDPHKLPLETLLARLENDSSTEVQRMADRALRGRFGTLTRKDLPPFQAGLKSRRPHVCVCCADAVAALRSEAAAAVEDVTALLERPEEEVRLAALQALAALGEAGRSAAPALARLLQSNPDRRTGLAAAAVLARLEPDNPLIAATVSRVLEGLKPRTADEAKAALDAPLEREAVRRLLEIGEPATNPLFQSGLALWVPQKTRNKDVFTAVARYQAYAILSELANRAVLDDKLRLSLRSRAGTFRQSYVGKERALVTQAQLQAQLGQLSAAELEIYVKTAEAAETAAVKLRGLMTATKQEEAERKAAVELDYSRKLLDRGDRDKAKERLQDILTRYPGTRSAAEARKLLATLAE